MRTVTKKEKATGPWPRKFPGITADAKTLGRNRQHLFEVLMGRRHSPVLLARYKALQAEKAKKGGAK
jgi:hypothetical protein